MTQEQFLSDMIDKGWVKVKANELRKLLQSHQEREDLLNQQAHTMQDLSDMATYWKNKYENLKWSLDNNLVQVDIKV